MKILVTSDLQWSDDPRDAYRHAFVDELIRLIQKHKPDYLYILGDLTEAKDRHPARLVNMIVDHFVRIMKLCPIMILQGNHEYVDIDHPFFAFLSKFPKITWIDSPESYGGNFFMPHTRDHKKDWGDDTYWKSMNKAKFIFAHNIFTGVSSSTGHHLQGIPLSVFPDGAKVISGDVHEPQQLGCVTYVGAPYLCDFGDDYDPRVLLIDDERMTTKSIPVEGPQKRLIEATAGKLMEGGLKANKGDILKVRVNLSMEQSAKWSEFKDDVLKWGERHGFIIHAVQPVVTFNAKKVEASSKYESKDDEEYLREYGRRHGLDAKVLARGLKIMED